MNEYYPQGTGRYNYPIDPPKRNLTRRAVFKILVQRSKPGDIIVAHDTV
eukprot:gene43047-57259_t